MLSNHAAKLGGLLRHALTIAGGYLVAEGFVDESKVNEIIGGIMALAGLALSYFSPAKAAGSGDPKTGMETLKGSSS